MIPYALDMPDEAFALLVAILKDSKPNDRSEQGRYYAIVITEVEKARAIFLTYCTENEVQCYDTP